MFREHACTPSTEDSIGPILFANILCSLGHVPLPAERLSSVHTIVTEIHTGRKNCFWELVR